MPQSTAAASRPALGDPPMARFKVLLDLIRQARDARVPEDLDLLKEAIELCVGCADEWVRLDELKANLPSTPVNVMSHWHKWHRTFAPGRDEKELSEVLILQLRGRDLRPGEVLDLATRLAPAALARRDAPLAPGVIERVARRVERRLEQLRNPDAPPRATIAPTFGNVLSVCPTDHGADLCAALEWLQRALAEGVGLAEEDESLREREHARQEEIRREGESDRAKQIARLEEGLPERRRRFREIGAARARNAQEVRDVTGEVAPLLERAGLLWAAEVLRSMLPAEPASDRRHPRSGHPTAKRASAIQQALECVRVPGAAGTAPALRLDAGRRAPAGVSDGVATPPALQDAPRDEDKPREPKRPPSGVLLAVLEALERERGRYVEPADVAWNPWLSMAPKAKRKAMANAVSRLKSECGYSIDTAPSQGSGWMLPT